MFICEKAPTNIAQNAIKLYSFSFFFWSNFIHFLYNEKPTWIKLGPKLSTLSSFHKALKISLTSSPIHLLWCRLAPPLALSFFSSHYSLFSLLAPALNSPTILKRKIFVSLDILVTCLTSKVGEGGDGGEGKGLQRRWGGGSGGWAGKWT